MSDDDKTLQDKPIPRDVRQYIEAELISQRLSVQQKASHIEAPQAALNSARIYANRRNLLEAAVGVSRVAEIGVDNGDFSSVILEKLQPDELVLIDSWQQKRYASKETSIRDRFAQDPRVSICKGLSTEALETFPDDYFDLVYIDTNHTYLTTIEELRISRRKVAPGKWISGHDFCSGNVVGGVVYGVVPAVTEFLSEGGGDLFGLSIEPSGHFSFLIKTKVADEA